MPLKLPSTLSKYFGYIVLLFALVLFAYSMYQFKYVSNVPKTEVNYITYSNKTPVNLQTYVVGSKESTNELEVVESSKLESASPFSKLKRVYIKVSNTGGGDGSVEDPVNSLEQALDMVVDGGTIIFMDDYVVNSSVVFSKKVVLTSADGYLVTIKPSENFSCEVGDTCSMFVFLNPAEINGISFATGIGEYPTNLVYSENVLTINNSKFADDSFDRCMQNYDNSFCSKTAILKTGPPASIKNSFVKGFLHHYQSISGSDNYTNAEFLNNYFSNAYNSSILLTDSRQLRVTNNIFVNNGVDLLDTNSKNLLIVGNFFYSPISLMLDSTKESHIFANSFNSAKQDFSSVVLKGDNTGLSFLGPQDETHIGNYWDYHVGSLLANEDAFSNSHYVGYYETGELGNQVYDNKPLIGKNLLYKHYIYDYSLKQGEVKPGGVASLVFQKDYAIDYKNGVDIVLENIFNGLSYRVLGVYTGPKEISFIVPEGADLGNYRVGYYDINGVLKTTNVALLVVGGFEFDKLGITELTEKPVKFQIPQTQNATNIRAIHDLKKESLVISWDHNKTPGFEDADVYHIYRTFYPKSRAVGSSSSPEYNKTLVGTVRNTNTYTESNPEVLHNYLGVYEYSVIVENIVTKSKTNPENAPILEVYPYLINTDIDLISLGIGADTKNSTISETAKNNIQVGSNGIVDTYFVWSNKNQSYFKYVEGLTFYDFLSISPYEPFLLSTKRYKGLQDKYYIILSGTPINDFPEINLIKGFNNILITHKHDKLVYASDLLNSVPNAVSVVSMEYDSSTKYTKYSPDKDNFILIAGKGYFVEVSEPGTWKYSN